MSDKEDERPIRCLVRIKENGAKIVEPCWALDDCLDDPYGRGTRSQGLTQAYMMNSTTGKHSRSPIIFKGGKFNKGGLTVNFCPFCGADIKTHSEEGR